MTNMRILISICFLSLSTLVNAQVNTQMATAAAIPKSIKYQGKPVQIKKFQDGTGSYLAFTTQTGERLQKGEDEFKEAHLYGYLYRVKDKETPVLVWQMHDMVTDCNLDMVAAFVPDALSITDLDKNGKAEVWLTYRLACRGDVSPGELKIIMHEGAAKYARRGIGKLKAGNHIQPDGGTIASDDFGKTAATIKQYAAKLWNRYLLESM